MKIAENIKAIRLAKQIKQKVVADALGLEITAISNFENGKRDIRVSELESIAKALGVSVIDLITYPDKYEPSANSERKEEPFEAVLQIKLSKEKKDQVFQLMFGEHCLEILNK